MLNILGDIPIQIQSPWPWEAILRLISIR